MQTFLQIFIKDAVKRMSINIVGRWRLRSATQLMVVPWHQSLKWFWLL